MVDRLMLNRIRQIVNYTVIYILQRLIPAESALRCIQSAECWQIRYDAALIEWQT